MSVTIIDHSLIKHKLSIMRNKDTSTYLFKQALDEIAMLMAYEVSKNFPLKLIDIETPVCKTTGYELASRTDCLSTDFKSWDRVSRWIQNDYAECENWSHRDVS